MPLPLLRVPYTEPLPLPRIIPASAATASGAIAALVEFLSAAPSSTQRSRNATPQQDTSAPGRDGTVLLTGAGLSVASGLADYRGAHGTYTLNRKYRPIYFNEFCANHEARKRYWARSFLGWTSLHRAKPNAGHHAVGELGRLGIAKSIITQNVDSFHTVAHPLLPTVELHGYLRSLVCLSCRNEYPRSTFQTQLSALNPAWSAFLSQMLAAGALDTENPDERRAKGLKTNPDGDVDLPDAPYSTFRYPACPACLASPQTAHDGTVERVDVDVDGALAPTSTGGILKPAVIMFGESIPHGTKEAAEHAVDAAERVLVVGSSLATYSAWRLVKRAKESGTPIAVLNIGGVRGEETFFADVVAENTGRGAVRASGHAEKILPQVVKILSGMRR